MNLSKEELLEKAKRDYTERVLFKRPSKLSDELDECFRNEVCVSTGQWQAWDNQDGNGLFIHNEETCCYFAGQWAEILPEEKKYFKVSDNLPLIGEMIDPNKDAEITRLTSQLKEAKAYREKVEHVIDKWSDEEIREKAIRCLSISHEENDAYRQGAEYIRDQFKQIK